MPGTGTELPPWLDLAPFRQVTTEMGDVLVVDDLDPFSAEHADLAPGGEAATATTTTTAASALVVATVAIAPTVPAPAAVPTAIAATLGAATEAGTVAAARSTATRIRSTRTPAPTIVAPGTTGTAHSGFLLCNHGPYLQHVIRRVRHFIGRRLPAFTSAEGDPSPVLCGDRPDLFV